jgi:NAD(P)H-hydrate epimerase
MLNDVPNLPRRQPDTHKGDYGRALLVGGSRGMSGAISLAGMAALRGGAGLVTLAVPDRCLETVAGFEPCYMTLPVPCDERGYLTLDALPAIQSAAGQATCVALGPGLGRTPGITQLVTELYTSLACPLVLDADGLNALSSAVRGFVGAAGPRILTPHPGEFRRIVAACRGADGDEGDEGDESLALQLAEELGAVIVLKGHRTLVTDGRLQYHNQSGNPGMATGGSGDILTGLITALVCQGLSGYDAARLGVWVHGRAGDLTALRLGQVGMMARDLLDDLPLALCEVEA